MITLKFPSAYIFFLKSILVKKTLCKTYMGFSEVAEWDLASTETNSLVS